MEDQVANSSDLLRMPLHIIEEILSNVLNLSNVSRTCKTLYEIVCDMEKRKRVVISIKRVATTNKSVRLTTIDDDAVFASIMNSRRGITEIRLDLYYFCLSSMELNERQLERITAIMKRFGSSITSLILSSVVLSSNEIIDLLSLTPKLETLKFAYGTASGNATKPLRLPNLKTLEIMYYTGLVGSLNYFSDIGMGKEPEILKTVHTEQHNIKSLTIRDYFSDPIVVCVNHLQLDKLKLVPLRTYTDDQLVEFLQCHTNLKELRLIFQISVRAFEWICNNLKKLEVFEVEVDGYNPLGKNFLVMLGELTKLRYLSTNVIDSLDYEVEFEISSLEKLKTEEICHFSENFNEKVHSMARTFINLTDLEINLEDFSELSVVLSQCTKLIRLKGHLEQPDPQLLAGNRFPNIRQLEISTYLRNSVTKAYDFDIIFSIVRAMPNLKSLSMFGCTIKFNIDKLNELVCDKNSLEDLYLYRFKLDDNLSTPDEFVNSVRCLSDNLKTYRLTFLSSNGNSDLQAVRNLLSNEFKVRDDPYSSSGFDLYKGDLTKFYD